MNDSAGCTEPECEHEWHEVQDWEGDPGVINGTHIFYYYVCGKCGEERGDQPDDFDRQQDDGRDYEPDDEPDLPCWYDGR